MTALSFRTTPTASHNDTTHGRDTRPAALHHSTASKMESIESSVAAASVASRDTFASAAPVAKRKSADPSADPGNRSPAERSSSSSSSSSSVRNVTAFGSIDFQYPTGTLQNHGKRVFDESESGTKRHREQAGPSPRTPAHAHPLRRNWHSRRSASSTNMLSQMLIFDSYPRPWWRRDDLCLSGPVNEHNGARLAMLASWSG